MKYNKFVTDAKNGGLLKGNTEEIWIVRLLGSFQQSEFFIKVGLNETNAPWSKT